MRIKWIKGKCLRFMPGRCSAALLRDRISLLTTSFLTLSTGMVTVFLKAVLSSSVIPRTSEGGENNSESLWFVSISGMVENLFLWSSKKITGTLLSFCINDAQGSRISDADSVILQLSTLRSLENPNCFNKLLMLWYNSEACLRRVGLIFLFSYLPFLVLCISSCGYFLVSFLYNRPLKLCCHILYGFIFICFGVFWVFFYFLNYENMITQL